MNAYEALLAQLEKLANVKLTAGTGFNRAVLPGSRTIPGGFVKRGAMESYVSELAKIAEHQYTTTEIDRAGRRQDLEAQQFRRDYKGAPATGEEREIVRRFAQKTIALPQQKGLRISLKDWVQRLIRIIETRRPEIREKIIESLKESVKQI